MARKDLLKGLMEAATNPAASPEESTRVDAARPRYKTGAIGAVSQSIAELKSRSLAEIDTDLIDAGGLSDRVDADDPDLAGLIASIRDYGQQVPVLLRPHPTTPNRYQVVYGRRRLAALRVLSQPVKAMIRDLDDTAVVVAQGQENSARKDLTFIEKANFARQMRDAGYDRKIICDALTVDKTQISRMLSVADAIPIELIEAVGSAPSVGRDRWLGLAGLLADTETDTDAALGMINLLASEDGSDARFAALVKALTLPRRRDAEDARARDATPETLRGADGQPLGQISRGAGKTVLTLKSSHAPGFDDWLVRNIAEIHRDWSASRDE